MNHNLIRETLSTLVAIDLIKARPHLIPAVIAFTLPPLMQRYIERLSELPQLSQEKRAQNLPLDAAALADDIVDIWDSTFVEGASTGVIQRLELYVDRLFEKAGAY